MSSSSLVSSASDIRPATVGKINCDNFIYADVKMGSLNSYHCIKTHLLPYYAIFIDAAVPNSELLNLMLTVFQY